MPLKGNTTMLDLIIDQALITAIGPTLRADRDLITKYLALPCHYSTLNKWHGTIIDRIRQDLEETYILTVNETTKLVEKLTPRTNSLSLLAAVSITRLSGDTYQLMNGHNGHMSTFNDKHQIIERWFNGTLLEETIYDEDGRFSRFVNYQNGDITIVHKTGTRTENRRYDYTDYFINPFKAKILSFTFVEEFATKTANVKIKGNHKGAHTTITSTTDGRREYVLSMAENRTVINHYDSEHRLVSRVVNNVNRKHRDYWDNDKGVEVIEYMYPSPRATHKVRVKSTNVVMLSNKAE